MTHYVRNIGVQFDAEMTMESHVTAVCKSMLLLIIITVLSSHIMDKHLALWRTHKNNKLFKSRHIILHLYSKIKCIKSIAVKLIKYWNIYAIHNMTIFYKINK